MQFVIVVLLVATLGVAPNFALGNQAHQRTRVSPIQKVLAMMKDMLEKAKTEKGDEVAAFAQFKQLCDSQRGEKERSIEDAKASIEQLKADGQKAESDAASLSKDIQGLSTGIDQFQADMKRANAIRDKDRADYQAEHDEYSASISSTEKAAMVIQQEGSASSLLQLQSLRELSSSKHLITRHSAARSMIMSFLQRPQSEVSMMQASLQQAASAPEARAFESSSGSILNMVEKLGEKFSEERAQLEKDEGHEVYNHQMAIQELTNQVDAATKARDMKMSQKAQKEQGKNDADGERSNTQATLDEDSKFLSDTNSECALKSTDFETKQVLRAGEITAIKKAMEIMGSDNVAGAGSKHLPGMIQEDATSLAQLRSGSAEKRTFSELSAKAQSRAQRQSKVAAFLAVRAHQTRSRVLSLISLKVSSDPFKKVTQMIKDMITKLMEEANEEAEHKGFCDTEMGTNKLTRDAKTEESETLHAQIDELGAAVAKLSDESAELSAAVAELDAAVGQATKLRQAEKAKNKATIAEAKVAQEAVASAVAVLREFYEKGSFTQTSSAVVSSSFDSDFAARASLLIQSEASGQAEADDSAPVTQDSSGVVGMLEVIESDFARLDAETGAAETDAERIHRAFINDSEQDKSVKSADLDFKQDSQQEKSSALLQAQHDLKGTTAELQAAMAYFEKLKPSCVDAEVSYEDRVQQRKDEIESLKEALDILSGEGI